MNPVLNRIRVNGVELAYWERGRRRDDLPTLLFIHATGFHGRVFDRLLESFPEFHSICLEQRGHGRSENVAVTHWRSQGEDVAEFVCALGLRDVIGIGHSMGGHAMVDAAASTGAFARLVLLDPTIASPEAYATEGPLMAVEGGVHPAARRKNDFGSPEEMAERLLPKGAYGLFERRILDDYCRFGLIPTVTGRYELACPPEVEASVYMTSRSNGGVLESARRLTIPVTIMRAMEPTLESQRGDFSFSPTWPGLVDEFPNAREIYLPDCTHFIPMQMPDRVVSVIREEVALWTPQ
jgi:pimeloyl-ACP methyl ester carboxylesterase